MIHKNEINIIKLYSFINIVLFFFHCEIKKKKKKIMKIKVVW